MEIAVVTLVVINVLFFISFAKVHIRLKALKNATLAYISYFEKQRNQQNYAINYLKFKVKQLDKGEKNV